MEGEVGVMGSYEELDSGSSCSSRCLSPSKSSFCFPAQPERAPASTSVSSRSSPWETDTSQEGVSHMMDLSAIAPGCPLCNMSGTGVSTGVTTGDKALPISVEYWQRKAMNLCAENEDLRRRLGLAQSTKALAVQEVLTQLFVEKVQHVYALGSIIDSPAQLETDEKQTEQPSGNKSPSIKKNLSKTSFAQLDMSDGLDKNQVLSLSEMEYNEHFQGLDRLDAVEVLERTCNIELLLQMVLKDVPVIISHCDKDLSYTYVKFVDQPLTGVLPEAMKGKKDTDLVGLIPGALETMKIKKEVLETGIAQGKELTVTMDGFGKRWLVVTCEALRNKAGQILGVITACMDVTEQAFARERLAQMREEMAVREATEKELRRAIRLADEAMEAKNSFLAVMSHEIRTPLNGVLGMAQVLETTSLDLEQRELVTAMVFSADVLLAIISDVLDLSKVESGTMKLEERELNPRDIIKHVVRTAIAASKDRGISIQAEVGDDVPALVYGDPLRIKQVITNLVFNAVKFTKKGYVKVRLHVVRPSTEKLKRETHRQCGMGTLETIRKAEEIEGDVERVERNVTGILSASSPLMKLGGMTCEDIWDPLLEGGRRDIPELSIVEEEADNINEGRREPIGQAVQGHRLVKMHSAGMVNMESLQDSDKVGEVFEADKKAASENEQSPRDLWLRFEIEDTGIGIPKEAIPTLFEKFTQVHSSTTRKYGGTGLGLAICKQLVELMEGQISVNSNVGKGSIFTFTLCCKRPPPVSGTASATKLVSETMMKQNLSQSTAYVHKLQAGMSYPSSKKSLPSIHALNQNFEEVRESRRAALMDTSALKGSTKIPRSSLKVRSTNDSDFNDLWGGFREKSKSWEEEAYSHTASWAARQGGLKENEFRDRSGPSRGGLRRTSSGPSRIECLMMGDFDQKPIAVVPATAPASDKKLPSLLLAEDNKVNVMVALSMLKKLGLSADVAYNGMEAIKAMQTKRYDLVLMDICMPILDGLEVTRRIRRYENLGYWDEESTLKPIENDMCSSPPPENIPLYSPPQKQTSGGMGAGVRKVKRMPIVAMTANALSDCEKQCSATGMDSFMTKPVTFKKLKDVLSVYLSHKSSLSSP